MVDINFFLFLDTNRQKSIYIKLLIFYVIGTLINIEELIRGLLTIITAKIECKITTYALITLLRVSI